MSDQLDLKELKKLFDKAYVHGQVTRERASDDLVFYWITQWDDTILADSQLAYRGEFDILRKAGRQIMADLSANEVQVDFEPIDETRDDAADLLDGLYRNDDNKNTSHEAYQNAQIENVVCGTGAWELFTEYISKRNGNKFQVITRRPIHEANNVVFWDPNAKLLDKSDGKHCGILRAYSHDGYLDLVEELTGERPLKVDVGSFKHPGQSFIFPWLGSSSKKIYVVNFYHKTKVKDKILTLTDPFGETRLYRESELFEVMDEMIDAGFEITDEKEIERWQIKKYIASGAEILSVDDIAGEHIPVVSVYGERAIIEGEEHYEGVTRLAKDPQRLHNFQLSYLADIVSRSPRRKAIFFQEQIAGFEDMYSETGIENNYPYLLQNRLAGDGSELPIGPVGEMPDQAIPEALITSVELSRRSVEDVANPGLPEKIAEPDLSGKAVLALQARIDMQSMVYQQNMKHAKRRDGEIYASMASVIYDVPREVSVTLPDGSRTTKKVMQSVVDKETGNIITINDLNSSEFEVFSRIGPSYTSKKEQTIDRLETLLTTMAPGDQMRNVLLLKLLRVMDGVDFEDIREYANNQLIVLGIKKPQTKEEQEMYEKAQQAANKPSAEMLLAQAEMLKGQADILREKREDQKVGIDASNEQQKRLIEEFEAITKRLIAEIKAEETKANIKNKNVDTFSKKLDNTGKIIELRQPKDMSTDELFKKVSSG